MQYKLRTSPLQFVNPELPLSLDHQKQPAAHEFDLMGETPNCLERLAKSSLKNLLRVISSKVDLFRQITTAQFSVLPTHIKAAVTPIYIPIDPTIVIDGVASSGRQIEAEWVDYSPNNKERVVLFVHGGGFVCTSRKTHRVLTWRISKYAHARVLCTGS